MHCKYYPNSSNELASVGGCVYLWGRNGNQIQMICVEKVQLQQSQKNPKKLNRFFKFWIEIEYKLPSCNQSCRRSRELLSFEERVCWGMMFVFNSLTYLSTETRKPFLKGVEGRLVIYTYLHSYRHCCHISAVNRPSTCAGWTNRWSCWVVWQLKDVKTHSRLERSQAFIYGSVPAGHLFFKSHIWSIVGFYSAVKHRRIVKQMFFLNTHIVGVQIANPSALLHRSECRSGLPLVLCLRILILNGVWIPTQLPTLYQEAVRAGWGSSVRLL